MCVYFRAWIHWIMANLSKMLIQTLAILFVLQDTLLVWWTKSLVKQFLPVRLSLLICKKWQWLILKIGLPPSAADIYDQPTSISWLYRAVGGLHSAVGLSVWPARRSGTHYRLSFVICLSVLGTLGAHLRQYCSRDISAFGAIEMHCIIFAI